MPSATTRYLLAKDGQTQIAVEMTDGLHALVWGRLWLSTEPHPVPLVEVPDAEAWVRAERVKRQISTADRLAGLRETARAGEAVREAA